MNLGGFFDQGDWEVIRSRLHHNDFHYRFYHYLSQSGGGSEEKLQQEIMVALMKGPTGLPESAAKAFKNWLAISESLHDLFERAPREAITDPDVVLARMALEQIDKAGFLASVMAVVRERAEHVLKECEIRNRELVEKAIEEPKRLVSAMDKFIDLFDTRGGTPHSKGERKNRETENHPLAADDAERSVRVFLDNCRWLDRALSDIPRRLQQGEVARETSDV